MDTTIAIAGLGMITAQGIGVDASWQGALNAQGVLHPWSSAPPSLSHLNVAQCPDPPRPADLPLRLWKKLSRIQQLAAVATDEALCSARLPQIFTSFSSSKNELRNSRIALFLATTVCGMDLNERFYAQYRKNKTTADSDLMRRLMPYEVGEFISRRHKIAQDPALRQVCLTTCVGSAMAIGNAADAIALGACDLAIAGGVEALCRVVLSGFNALKVVSGEGCRPFDLHRPGITVGEGAGILILESLAHARSRGVEPLAYLRGFGVTCDAHHLTAPDPSATQATRAIHEALHRASLAPSDIGYINAHGTGTRDNDAMEFRAIANVFGAKIPPVSSTKRSTGHTFGAAAAIESIFCIQALRQKFLPPNAGTQTPDSALPLPLVRNTSLSAPGLQAALCTNFAFGGNNTALVFSMSDDHQPHGRHAVHGQSLTSVGLDPHLKKDALRKGPEHAEWRRAGHESLTLQGMGVITDHYHSLTELIQSLPQNDIQNRTSKIKNLPPTQVLDPIGLTSHDTLTQLVLRATHQAWMMADLHLIPAERIGLIFVSAWGTIDSTVAYLDSMLDEEGRFASPRHFSRSVYSAVASLTAIHFNIRGPCETLALAKDPVQGAMHQARRLLAAGRADCMLIIWAEQSAEIAHDLTRRAATQLHRNDYTRYAKALGQGTIVLAVAPPAEKGLCQINLQDPFPQTASLIHSAPFASDAALAFIVHLLSSSAPN